MVSKWLYVGPVISVMSLLTDLCEMKISPAILINKKCYSHQRFLASKCEWGLPKHWSSRCCQPPQWLLRSWGNAWSKANKGTELAPDSWGAYERNEFSEPRGLHLPICSMLNSFTWNLIFLIAAPGIAKSDWVTEPQQSLMFRLPSPFLQILSHDSPSCLLGAVFSEQLRFCLLGLGPKHGYQIKSPSTFRGWLMFSLAVSM